MNAVESRTLSKNMAFYTLTIGRSRRADIRLEDASVSRLHAELTMIQGGRCYLTDRNSLRGTQVLRNGRWASHRQGYVDSDAKLLFGKCEVFLSDLLKGRSFPDGAASPSFLTVSVKPRRNVETGEVET